MDWSVSRFEPELSDFGPVTPEVRERAMAVAEEFVRREETTLDPIGVMYQTTNLERMLAACIELALQDGDAEFVARVLRAISREGVQLLQQDSITLQELGLVLLDARHVFSVLFAEESLPEACWSAISDGAALETEALGWRSLAAEGSLFLLLEGASARQPWAESLSLFEREAVFEFGPKPPGLAPGVVWSLSRSAPKAADVRSWTRDYWDTPGSGWSYLQGLEADFERAKPKGHHSRLQLFWGRVVALESSRRSVLAKSLARGTLADGLDPDEARVRLAAHGFDGSLQADADSRTVHAGNVCLEFSELEVRAPRRR
ncbi:MAG: hypothetical protein WD226_11940 [Planctomycetota bacterium]